MPMHVVQRGHNRQECFRADADCQFYLAQLEDLAAEFGCAVHAYVLMTNHAHILVTPETSDGLSAMMKRLAQRHAQRFNRRYDRTGTLWEGRYRSSIVESDTYLLACYRYIEMNPVRAMMVEHPVDYRWSSHRANAYGEEDRILVPHPTYVGLGASPQMWRDAYRRLFAVAASPAEIEAIRHAARTNSVLGRREFVAQVERMTGRRVTPQVKGRPRGVQNKGLGPDS